MQTSGKMSNVEIYMHCCNLFFAQANLFERIQLFDSNFDSFSLDVIPLILDSFWKEQDFLAENFPKFDAINYDPSPFGQEFSKVLSVLQDNHTKIKASLEGLEEILDSFHQD